MRAWRWSAAGALHLLQLALDLDDAFADQAAVGFDLGFAGTAEEAEAAALAFQVGPASDQARALIGQMRELDLQPAFPRVRALAEDFQDQRRAVEHLGRPGLFQIALLHRRERRVDDARLRARGSAHSALISSTFPVPTSVAGRRPRDRGDQALLDFKSDRGGERYRLFETRFFAAARIGVGLARDMQHHRAGRYARRMPCPAGFA